MRFFATALVRRLVVGRRRQASAQGDRRLHPAMCSTTNATKTAAPRPSATPLAGPRSLAEYPFTLTTISSAAGGCAQHPLLERWWH